MPKADSPHEATVSQFNLLHSIEDLASQAKRDVMIVRLWSIVGSFARSQTKLWELAGEEKSIALCEKMDKAIDSQNNLMILFAQITADMVKADELGFELYMKLIKEFISDRNRFVHAHERFAKAYLKKAKEKESNE